MNKARIQQIIREMGFLDEIDKLGKGDFLKALAARETSPEIEAAMIKFTGEGGLGTTVMELYRADRLRKDKFLYPLGEMGQTVTRLVKMIDENWKTR